MYPSEITADFLSDLETANVKLNTKITSKHKDAFSSFLNFTSWVGEMSIANFMEEEAGIWEIGMDIQPTPRKSHGGLPDGVIKKLEEIYNVKPDLPVEAFVSLFIENMTNGPEPTGEEYKSEPEYEYESASLIDFLSSEFDTLYVAISGSRSDRWNSLQLRPRWHYEYWICALRYCLEAEEIQNDLTDLFESKINSNSFLTGRGPPINLDNEDNQEKKEMSDKEKLMAKYAVKPPENEATKMAKEAGITSLDNVNYKQLFRVYTEVLIQMMDHNLMNYWPLGMSFSSAPPANKQRNIFNLYRVSCEYFAE